MPLQRVYISVFWSERAKIRFADKISRVVGIEGLTPLIVAEHVRKEVAQKLFNERILLGDVNEIEASLYFEIYRSHNDDIPFLKSTNAPE